MQSDTDKNKPLDLNELNEVAGEFGHLMEPGALDMFHHVTRATTDLGKQIEEYLHGGDTVHLGGTDIAIPKTGYFPGNLETEPPRDTLRIYRSAIQNMCSNIKDGHNKNPLVTDRLRALADFPEEHFNWSYQHTRNRGHRTFTNDNRYNAVTGKRTGVYVAVIDPESDLIQREDPLGQEIVGNLNVLSIKPHTVTEIWAGLASMHEIDHMFVKHNRIQCDRPDLEVRAFEVSVDCMDYASSGYATERMKAALRQYHISTYQEALAFIQNPQNADKWLEVMRDIDGHITATPPLSDTEAHIRHTYYLVLLCFTCINQIPSPHDRHQCKRELMRRLYSKNWQGNEEVQYP